MLFVFGPGGIGKTTLLREFIRLCDDAQTPAAYLDGRKIEPAPDAFLHALRLALDIAPQTSPYERLASRPFRPVVMIDTYEMLASLDTWLREEFLPQLPENTLVVLAGREPPTPAWHTDPGWQTLVRTLPLRNLSPEESRLYLTRRNVPAGQHPAVLNFTHGHPLAISLVADVCAQRPDTLREFQPETAPDVVKTLLEQFVQKVPGPAHRAALEACALVRLTTEALLAEMLGMPDPETALGQGAHELFEWLRGLSFIELDRHGLFPHDLAREALAADVRWRNPDWHAELHRRARNYYTGRIQRSQAKEQRRHLLDLIFLHRDNPVVRAAFEFQDGGLFTDSLRSGDVPVVLDMVARHEGEESARLAKHWLDRQPQGALIFRGSAQQVGGFLLMLALQRADPDDLAADPATQSAWRYLQQGARLRSGEGATYFRFWMDRDAYQAISSTHSRAFLNIVQHYLTTPGLAYTFFPCADPDVWVEVLAYANVIRIPEADFEVGGRRYGVFGHDWRAEPPLAWLAMLADREVGIASQTPPPAQAEQLIVLSESDFAAAALDALRDFTRPDALRGSPLARSRLVVERVGLSTDISKRVAVLQSLIREAAESLQTSPRDAKLYRALYATYLQPAPTQEQAAERLDLPFSTYRRHLKAGAARLIDLLWRREISS